MQPLTCGIVFICRELIGQQFGKHHRLARQLSYMGAYSAKSLKSTRVFGALPRAQNAHDLLPEGAKPLTRTDAKARQLNVHVKVDKPFLSEKGFLFRKGTSLLPQMVPRPWARQLQRPVSGELKIKLRAGGQRMTRKTVRGDGTVTVRCA